MPGPVNDLIFQVRASRQPVRYLLLAAGSFAVAAASMVLGTVADAHHLSGLSHLAAVPAGLALGLFLGMLRMAYVTGIRGPSFARQLTAMVQAMDAGQQVSGRFEAALRGLAPGSPLTRWKRGRVVINAGSVIWVRRITGRSTGLTGAQCTGQRKPDPGYKDMTLTLPGYYNGEGLGVITMQANGAGLELAAPTRLLEILRYSLAGTTSGAR